MGSNKKLCFKKCGELVDNYMAVVVVLFSLSILLLLNLIKREKKKRKKSEIDWYNDIKTAVTTCINVNDINAKLLHLTKEFLIIREAEREREREIKDI